MTGEPTPTAWWQPTKEAAPTWILVAVLVVTGPLLLFHYGAYYWFRSDDWVVLTDPARGSLSNLLEPHGGSHLIVVPRVLYHGLWQVFGARAYWPYQLLVVITHVATAALLYAVMRRTNVRRWLAFAAVALFALVGPGARNALWAFQVGFNGSLAWGLAHLLLADHDGPFDRRDALGLACALAAITSSGVGISLTVAVASAVLLRRGWKLALIHATPLAVYGSWVVLADAQTSGPFGRPPIAELVHWTWISVSGTFLALGRFEGVAWILVAVVATGAVVALVSARSLPELARELSLPIGLAVGALFFIVTTGIVRSWGGDAFARGERYTYLEAALILPLAAAAAEAIVRRWRVLAPALVVLFLVPIPFNLSRFDQGAFDARWMDKQEYLLTTAPRMPFARDVPRDVVPAVDSLGIESVTIGFLLTAQRNGDLTPSTLPLTPLVLNEFRVRLGVAQRLSPERPTGCTIYDQPIDLSPQLGGVLHLGSPALISTLEAGQRSSPTIIYRPQLRGSELTIELPDLDLRIEPAPQAETFTLCSDG